MKKMSSLHVDVKDPVSVMDKIAKIKKHPNQSRWTVFSEKGKPMGTYNSHKAAKKRLRQIEFFKHKKINNILEPIFHGDKPSFLEVEIKTTKLKNIYKENNMKNNLYKLAKNLKMIHHEEEADDIMDLAKSIQTSSSETEFVKDIENSDDKQLDIKENVSLSSLTIMLSYLRAMQAWFHGAHHVTGGEGFAGDHTDLYTRIYEAILEDYDAAAEKAVGLSDESLACPIKVMDQANKIIAKFKSPCNLNATEIAKHGYDIIMKYLKFLDYLYKNLEESEELTLGLDDFIMAMANDYETFAYLLKQRSSDSKKNKKIAGFNDQQFLELKKNPNIVQDTSTDMPDLMHESSYSGVCPITKEEFRKGMLKILNEKFEWIKDIVNITWEIDRDSSYYVWNFTMIFSNGDPNSRGTAWLANDLDLSASPLKVIRSGQVKTYYIRWEW